MPWPRNNNTVVIVLVVLAVVAGAALPCCGGGVPMAFLAQIRLSDAVAYDPDARLPRSGMLYFFYEAQEQKWGFDPKDRTTGK